MSPSCDEPAHASVGTESGDTIVGLANGISKDSASRQTVQNAFTGSQMPHFPDLLMQEDEPASSLEHQAPLPFAVVSFDRPLAVHEPNSQTMASISLEQQDLWTPCWWHASLQVVNPNSENTTGCAIAFSMLQSNNSRGYRFSEIDARLQAAYRRDDSVAEGCSVLTKTLFQLLSEMS